MTANLYFMGREVQVPVITEQEHDCQMTVINDASGIIYPLLRKMSINDFDYRTPDNGYTLTVKARSDQQNTAGMNVVMKGVRINNVSGLDYSHQDGVIQTFTVDLYVNTTDFVPGEIKTKEGLLGKVDKISNKINNVLGM